MPPKRSSSGKKKSPAAESPANGGAAAAAEEVLQNVPAKKKAKKGGTALSKGIGKRVMTKKGDVFHSLSAKQQESFPSDSINKMQLFGTIVSGASTGGYVVEFDQFPSDDKTAKLDTSRLKAWDTSLEETTETASEIKRRKVANSRVKK